MGTVEQKTGDRQKIAASMCLMVELEGILAAFNSIDMPVVVLKGAGMMVYGLYVPGERQMDDIDLLVPRGMFNQTENSLQELGYKSLLNCPGEYKKDGSFFNIDITDNIWYLKAFEEKDVWERSQSYKLRETYCRVLGSADFLIHVLAHTSVHHARFDREWVTDIKVICEAWQSQLIWGEICGKIVDYGLQIPVYVALDSARKYGANVPEYVLETLHPRKRFDKLLFRFYLALLRLEHTDKGHVSLLIFQRSWAGRLRYLFKQLFPGKKFLFQRYSDSHTKPSKLNSFILALLRPLRLVYSFAKLGCKILILKHSNEC